ncbi:MAG: acyltransferase [Nitrospirae bacterium]|nr:acyltransferase [Nitrospirota bacterium]MBF0553595.1 acyltransferase [Nitrospirota bacterium]
MNIRNAINKLKKIIPRPIGFLVHELFALLRHITIFYPNSTLGFYIRELYYKKGIYLKIGERPIIGYGAQIYNDAPLEIGDDCWIGINVVIDPNDSFGILIGKNVGIANGCYIRAGNHNYYSLELPIVRQGHNCKQLSSSDGRKASIIIEDNIWIGARSILLSGAKIGQGSVISAGSVVSSEIPENSIVAGNPARVIANRTKINFKKTPLV